MHVLENLCWFSLLPKKAKLEMTVEEPIASFEQD